MDTASVIVAVGSPPGRSVRGIVRVSGTFEISDFGFQILDLKSEISNAKAGITGGVGRGVHRASLSVGEHRVAALVTCFSGPRSYTGEDCVEIQLPGNPALMERMIEELLKAARERGIEARRAEAGEFTARAFLNGRMSLTQAEGVAAVIAAQSDAELRAAALLRSGSLDQLARGLADELAWALAMVEAGIDFTDQEDVVAISPDDLMDRLGGIVGRIEGQLSRAVGMEQLQAIPWVVLVGEPNAGKSALFNALLGHERAVVSAVAGTTRDVLMEPLKIQTAHGPAEVMLVDLAGLDAHDDSPINRLMQQAADDAIRRAELVIRCVPIDVPMERAPDDDAMLVRAKADLLSSSNARGSAGRNRNEIAVSALSGEGLDKLRSAIAQRLADRAVSLTADATVLRPRHEAALRTTCENLREAIGLIERRRDERLSDPELVASAMRAGLDSLGTIVGQTTPDDIIGRVFSSFCIGK